MELPPDEKLFTLGIAATRIGGSVQIHHLDRLIRRNLIRHFTAGRIRLVALSDFPAIKAACEAAGYLQQVEQSTDHPGSVPGG